MHANPRTPTAQPTSSEFTHPFDIQNRSPSVPGNPWPQVPLRGWRLGNDGPSASRLDYAAPVSQDQDGRAAGERLLLAQCLCDPPDARGTYVCCLYAWISKACMGCMLTTRSYATHPTTMRAPHGVPRHRPRLVEQSSARGRVWLFIFLHVWMEARL